MLISNNAMLAAACMSFDLTMRSPAFSSMFSFEVRFQTKKTACSIRPAVFRQPVTRRGMPGLFIYEEGPSVMDQAPDSK
jgi:hypothetical protein